MKVEANVFNKTPTYQIQGVLKGYYNMTEFDTLGIKGIILMNIISYIKIGK